MEGPDRQAQVNEIIARALETDPSLRQALELFGIGQREYIRALSGLRNVTITSAPRSNPPGDDDAQPHSHARGD